MSEAEDILLIGCDDGFLVFWRDRLPFRSLLAVWRCLGYIFVFLELLEVEANDSKSSRLEEDIKTRRDITMPCPCLSLQETTARLSSPEQASKHTNQRELSHHRR